MMTFLRFARWLHSAYRAVRANLLVGLAILRGSGARSASVSRPSIPSPGDFGATAEYARQLHELGAMERLRGQTAMELGLDPLDPLDAPILDDAVTLRLSVAERLTHFRARWEREVEPLLSGIGERFIGPLVAATAVTADTFDGVRRQAHILALPAA